MGSMWCWQDTACCGCSTSDLRCEHDTLTDTQTMHHVHTYEPVSFCYYDRQISIYLKNITRRLAISSSVDQRICNAWLLWQGYGVHQILWVPHTYGNYTVDKHLTRRVSCRHCASTKQTMPQFAKPRRNATRKYFWVTKINTKWVGFCTIFRDSAICVLCMQNILHKGSS